MSSDLVAFLNARLDEDDLVLRESNTSPEMVTGIPRSYEEAPVAIHVARFASPDRVLAEVEAKRQIMECHEPWVAANGDTICGRCGREHIDGRSGGHFPCQTLRLLAAVYADNPDYQQEWAL